MIGSFLVGILPYGPFPRKRSKSCISYRVPYNKLLTNLACSSRTGEYWPSVVFVRTSRCSVRTVTTSGQYSPVRPSRSVSKRLLSQTNNHNFPLKLYDKFFDVVLLSTSLAFTENILSSGRAQSKTLRISYPLRRYFRTF